jgi:FtsP/CotA-like multicopper oxidase with cupredoxin domain
MRVRRSISIGVVALTLVAASMHAWAMPEHFAEWWGYGAFFLVVAAVQGFYGVALLRRPGPPLFLLGIAGNLAVVVLYIVTRTFGIPFFGPHAGVVEEVGILGLSAMVVQVTLVAALVASLRVARPGGEDSAQGLELARTGESGSGLSRRDFLRSAGVAGALGISGGALGLRAAGVTGSLGAAGVALGAHAGLAAGQEDAGGKVAGDAAEHDAGGHEGMVGQHGGKGDVDLSRFDPSEFLRAFYWGEERQENGRTVREYEMVAQDAEIEVAPGVFYPAWTFNGQVPGPTLRAREGDRLRVVFKNRGTHPHTIHFHGIHAANMDGSMELVGPGQEFVYEFDAEPFGMHLYHCHVTPLRKHIEKGLYGVFIIDPKEGRLPADEMVMVMNGFDTNFDTENEVYTVNGVAFHYQRHPVKIKRGELVRVYLANFTEFDLINSMHMHANFFDYYPTGTKLEPTEFTDTKMLAQGERGIMEFTYEHPGLFMFHAHVNEFAELGWLGFFEVEE